MTLLLFLCSSTEIQNEHETVLSSCVHIPAHGHKPLLDNDGCSFQGKQGKLCLCMCVCVFGE